MKIKNVLMNWQSIIAALVVLGIVTGSDPTFGLISLVGMLLVALLNFMARSFRLRIGAGWLTIMLYAISMALAIMLETPSLPAFPDYVHQDPAGWMEAIAAYFAQCAPLAGMLTASATLVYNALKPLVWDKILPIVDEIGRE